MKKLWMIPLLLISLASCRVIIGGDEPSTTVSGSVYIQFGVPLVNVITEFQPDRGRGGNYGIGERISFRVGVRRSGYITLVNYNPDGSVDVLASQAVSAGTQTLPAPGSGFTYTVGPPYGRNYVRMFFSSRPLVYGYQGRGFTTTVWDDNTQQFLRSLPEDSRDVRETYFDVR